MSGHPGHDPCGEFDLLRRQAEAGGEPADRWREHLAGCADCRDQERADELLRAALMAPAPGLAAGFEDRLRRRLEERATGPAAAPRRWARGRRPGWWRRPAWWLLAGYATAAAAASAVILAQIPWQSLTPSPALGIAFGALAALSPLVLLDRVGIVRPPG